MVMQGGCDRSDEFLPYAAHGMLLLKACDYLKQQASDDETHTSPEDDAMIKRASEFFYKAILWMEYLCERRSHSAFGEDKEFELVVHLFGPLKDIPRAEAAWKPVYRTWHTLNVVVAEQRPRQDDLEQAGELCLKLGEICCSLSGDNHRNGCF